MSDTEQKVNNDNEKIEKLEKIIEEYRKNWTKTISIELTKEISTLIEENEEYKKKYDDKCKEYENLNNNLHNEVNNKVLSLKSNMDLDNKYIQDKYKRYEDEIKRKQERISELEELLVKYQIGFTKSLSLLNS